MLLSITLVTTLAYLATCQALDIRHTEADGVHLVETSRETYGLSSSNLTNNWKTLHVSGGIVTIYTASCERKWKSWESLTEQEARQYEEAKTRMESLENNFKVQTELNRFIFTHYSTEHPYLPSIVKKVGSFEDIFQSEGFIKYDEHNFSVSQAEMPNSYARVLILSDVVAYVYADGRVEMKPSECLSMEELQYIVQLKEQLAKSEEEERKRKEKFALKMGKLEERIKEAKKD